MRKGDRTRARLIAATVQVLGQVGYTGASVLEITKAAKVSNATFYLYFKSKDEIIDAAVFQVAAEITRRIDEHEQNITDLVLRCVYAMRYFMTTVLDDPAWAKAMLATFAAVPEQLAWRGVNKFMLRTLREGVERGVFDIEGSPLEVECINRVMMTTVQMQLEGAAGPDAIQNCITLVLKMLGVGSGQAKAAALWAATAS